MVEASGHGTTYATRAILLRGVLVGRRTHADGGPRGRGPESPAQQEGHGSPVGPRVADESMPERRERQRRLVLVRELRAERLRGGVRTETAPAEGSRGATSAVPARPVSPRELMRELGVVEVAERQRVVYHDVCDLRRDVA